MNDLQFEQLFTELTPTQAAVIGGAAQFRESVDFDFFRSTRSFKVRPSGTISLFTKTSSTDPDLSKISFNASVRNVKTGKRTPAEQIIIGFLGSGVDIPTRWTNMRGGTYRIDFVDAKDGIRVRGNIDVVYDA